MRRSILGVAGAVIMGLAVMVVPPAAHAADPPLCTIGAPFVKKNPIPVVYPGNLVAIEATNTTTVSAGVAWDGRRVIEIFRIVRGQFQALDRITFAGTYASPRVLVRVVAVTRSGAVIASVRPNPNSDRSVGYIYDGHTKKALARSSSWYTSYPTGISPSGDIVGLVSTAAGRTERTTFAVEWNAAGTLYHRVAYGLDDPQINEVGDIAGPAIVDGQAEYGATAYTHTGARVALAQAYTNTYTALAAGGSASSIYGTNVDPAGNQVTVVWSLAGNPVDGDVIHPTVLPYMGRVEVVGPNGALVASVYGDDISNGARYLRSSGGVRHRMPADRLVDGNGGFHLPVAVSATGAVIYTAAGDGLPHVFACRT